MLMVGDELKVIEEIRHNKSIKKRTTIGIIQQITPHNIILKKTNYNVSFNIGDCRDTKKHFYKKENEQWIPIKIKVTEHGNDNFKGGGKYS